MFSRSPSLSFSLIHIPSLCLTMAIWLRDNGEPLPRSLVLMSPWTDLSNRYLSFYLFIYICIYLPLRSYIVWFLFFQTLIVPNRGKKITLMTSCHVCLLPSFVLSLSIPRSLLPSLFFRIDEFSYIYRFGCSSVVAYTVCSKWNVR